MAIQIHVTIEGLNHAINFTSKFPSQYRTERRNLHNRLGDKGAKIFQSKAHVDTGKMKGGIKKGQINENIMEVVSPVKYSVFENRRGGSHAFFTQGSKQLTEEAKREEINLAKTVLARKGQ